MSKSILKFCLFFLLSAIFVLIDQFTKSLAFKYLLNQKPIVIIDNVLELVYVENHGAAFGILQNKQNFFYILTIVVLSILLYYLYKLDFNKNSILQFCFILFIFSGAIGNFIDRIKNKYVIDFIYFKPIDFPVFNFADILITIGCIFMILTMVLMPGDKN